jgi:hypothetical protein
VRLGEDDVWRAAELFRDVLRSCEEPAKLRQVMAAIVKKASIRGAEVALDYWPESIVSAVGGSQCPVTWLPGVGTGRTRRMVVQVEGLRRRVG